MCGIIRTFGVLCFLKKNAVETIKKRCHTVSCSVCRKTDPFEKLLFFRQNISADFIIHSFTCSVFISVFAFFIILCEVAKLARTAPPFDLVSSEYIMLPLQIRCKILKSAISFLMPYILCIIFMTLVIGTNFYALYCVY